MMVEKSKYGRLYLWATVVLAVDFLLIYIAFVR